MKGLKYPSIKMGIVFASGKFDLNNTALPLSAFVDAMAALTKIVVEGDEKTKKKILSDIDATFVDEDVTLLGRALPGCEELLRMPKSDAKPNQILSLGKEAIARLQYAIRRLLKIVCTQLKGVVLFIDDLQWADTATLDLLKSISLDGDIQSLLLVGAYREDEVPE